VLPSGDARQRVCAFCDDIGGRTINRIFVEQEFERLIGRAVPLIPLILQREDAHAIEEDNLHRRSSSTRAASSTSPWYRQASAAWILFRPALVI
jgi:hypothetical protein